MHFRETKKKKRISQRSLAKLILVCEFMCFACLIGIFNISIGHIADRRTDAVFDTFARSDSGVIKTAASDSYKATEESVYEVVDETVWATADVNYRTGPDTEYDSAGTLAIYTGVKRTGLTYNDWSQVSINGDEYYISSDVLTTDPPLITDTGAKGDYERYALSLFSDYGWADSEITPLIRLWNRESSWNPAAHNRSSGAHGIPQALPASKMASFGSDYYTNGYTQIRWGLSYIANRYGSPSRAWAHSQSSGWY